MEKEKIEGFICDNSKKINGNVSIIGFFDNLVIFLRKEKIKLNCDEILELLRSNKIIYDMIDCLYKSYSTQIQEGYLEKFFSNSLLISFIEMYCAINSIELNKQSMDVLCGGDTIEDIFFNEIYTIPLLNHDEEKKLIMLAQSDDETARKRMIECNLRLVASIARGRMGRGLPLADIIQEGCLGLMKAIKCFDVSLGYCFSTYAVPWIKQTIDRAIDQQTKNIRIPGYLLEKIRKTKRINDQLTSKLNRTPTLRELSKATGYSEMKVDEYLSMKIDVYSFDSPALFENAQFDEGLAISDILTDEEDLEEKVILSQFQSELRAFLEQSNFPIRYVEVIKLRFGFFNNYEYTLETVASIYGVTRERIRQIEKKALKAMKNDHRVRNLIGYLNCSEKTKKEINEQLDICGNNNKELKYFKEDSFSTERIDKSIYDIFEIYDISDVDSALALLDESDAAVLHICYGERIKKPVFNAISQQVKKRFDEYLIPKIRKLLAKDTKEDAYQKSMGTMVS